MMQGEGRPSRQRRGESALNETIPIQVDT
jgi:hypothetical protein